MATCVELSRESLHVARVALREDCFRNSVSRSYYAAYAAVTAELVKAPGMMFGYRGNNPAHTKLIGYVQMYFPLLGHDQMTISDIKDVLSRLYRDRVQADYMPQTPIGAVIAKRNVRHAQHVLTQLGTPT